MGSACTRKQETKTMMLTTKEAAALLGVPPSTMYSLAAPRGPVPCYRIGTAIRFKQADLDAYLESRRCEPVDLFKNASPTGKVVVRLKTSDPLDFSRETAATPNRKPVHNERALKKMKAPAKP